MEPLEKGKRIPNWVWTDSAGEIRHAWDWRQKSNLILIALPQCGEKEQSRWEELIAIDRAQWAWLQTDIQLVTSPPDDLLPGIHAVDRYGIWMRSWPLDQWSFEELEREYVYHEARHC